VLPAEEIDRNALDGDARECGEQADLVTESSRSYNFMMLSLGRGWRLDAGGA